MNHPVNITDDKATRLVTFLSRKTYPNLETKISINRESPLPDGMRPFRQVDVKSSSGLLTIATFAVFKFEGKGYAVVSDHNGGYDKFGELETTTFDDRSFI